MSSRLYTDEGGEFKGECHKYLENAAPKKNEGTFSKIEHCVFAPSTGTKRRFRSGGKIQQDIQGEVRDLCQKYDQAEEDWLFQGCYT